VARALWLMVVGRVVAASVNEDCIDENGWAILDKLRPAHYCGQAYSGDNKFRFVASYEMLEVDTVYDGPEASRVQLDQAGQRR